MERRALFRLGLKNTLNALVQGVEERTDRQTARWFRPPFAIRELYFQLSCTRCDKCIQACPYGVLFALPFKYGPQVAGTPVLDLLQKGCRLCRDWPCVAACEPQSLRLPPQTEGVPPPLPHLSKAKIDPLRCLPFMGPECGACQGVCPVPGALAWQGARPTVVESVCVGCGMCREACVTAPKSIHLVPIILEASSNTDNHEI
ncbi:MAG: 4Fe-4S binding protein [Magnetococcus sp. DMHC-6]